MRLQIFMAAISLILLTSCKKSSEKTVAIQSYEMGPNPSWPTIRFKTDYDIQVPSSYEGAGMYGFEGNIFSKYNTLDSTYIAYFYSDGLFCHDFWGTLPDPLQPSVTVSNPGVPTVVLSNRIEFTRNNQLEAILFYNSSPSFRGDLYMKDNADFKQSLYIAARPQNLPEIVDIIRTIKTH